MTTAQIALSLMAGDILEDDALHAHLATFYLAALNALAEKKDWMGWCDER